VLKNKIKENIPVCGLCGREIPDHVPQSKHHLIPRSKGGKKSPVILLHHQCHKEIHSKFSDSALAISYNSVNKLRNSSQLKGFIRWIEKRPPGFLSRTKRPTK